MLSCLNSGSVCAVYDEFVIILIAFFCILEIFSILVLEVQPTMAGQ